MVAGCALLLTACFPLGTRSNAVALYGVTLRERAAAGPPANWQLAVEEPVALDSLAGSRIVLVPDDGAIGAFKDARWTDRAPRLIETLLVRAFEDSGRITGVGSARTGIRPDFSLLSDLRAFQAEYPRDGHGEVAVVLSARVVRYSTNRAVAARVFTARVPIDGRGVAPAVASFERALDGLIPQVVDWTFQVGNAAAVPPGASHPGRSGSPGPRAMR